MSATMDAWNDERNCDPYDDLDPEGRALRDAAVAEIDPADELAALREFIEGSRPDPHSSIGVRDPLLEEVAAFVTWLLDSDIWATQQPARTAKKRREIRGQATKGSMLIAQLPSEVRADLTHRTTR